VSTVTTEQVEQVVVKALEEFGADAGDINRDATFEKLDIDSLDLAELAQIVEEEFGVELKSDDIKSIKTVGAAIDLVAARA
jgi:acyl carrier protein